MAYFPCVIDLTDKKVVIGGGGSEAKKKALTMLSYDANVSLVALDMLEEIEDIKDDNFTIVREEIETDHIKDAYLVIMATDDEEKNREISDYCKANKILINVVDEKDESSFIFPAVYRQDNVVVAASTSGENTMLAKKILDEISVNIDKSYGKLSKNLGKYSDYIFEKIVSPDDRKKAFEMLIAKGMEEDGDISEDYVDDVIEELSDKVIKIGTRGSELAMIQTSLVIENLRVVAPDYDYEVVEIVTQGDKNLFRPLHEFGGKGVFVEEFEDALEDGDIDMAVHSANNLPIDLKNGLIVGGVLQAADPREVLITKKDVDILKKNLKVACSNVRRSRQIEKLYPNVKCTSFRGNADTMVQKLREGKYDAIVIAAAGLSRMNLLNEEDLEYHIFEVDEMVPAAGQGIIAIETRKDGVGLELADRINDKKTFARLELERMAMKQIGEQGFGKVGINVDFSQGEMKAIAINCGEDELVTKTANASSDDNDACEAEIKKLVESIR